MSRSATPQPLTVLLDTPALVALANPQHARHAVAVAYFRESLRADATLYLSVIAAAEFQQGQAVTDLPLRNLVVLPFNIDHAMVAGEVHRSLRGTELAGPAAAVADDVKLIAQGMAEGVSHVLTDGRCTLAQLLERLREAGRCRIECIDIEEDFEPAWFTGGQRALLPPE